MRSALRSAPPCCSSPAAPVDDRTPKPVRGSPDYQEGWREGCVSGLYLRNLREGGAAQAGDRFVHNADAGATAANTPSAGATG